MTGALHGAQPGAQPEGQPEGQPDGHAHPHAHAHAAGPVGASHPLLALTPPARRELARTLVHALEDYLRAERSRRTRGGAIAAAGCAAVGGGLFLGWQALTGAAGAPVALWLGLGFGVQAAIGRALAGAEPTEGTSGEEAAGAAQLARRALLAPDEVVRALQAWVWPPRFTPDRLVLAAGLLVAARRPVSYHLMRRLYARAYPQAEVDRAIALLGHVGYLSGVAGEGSSVLALTPAGAELVRALGVPAPAPRPLRDPAVAPHLVPVFAALEVGPAAGGSAAAAGVSLPRPGRPMPRPAPIPDPPPEARPAPESERMPWSEPLPELAPDAPEAPPFDEADAHDEDTGALVRPGAWRQLATGRRPLAIAGAVALAGLLVWLSRPYWPGGEARTRVALSAAGMPHSRGTALQFNGRGLMLSSFGGGLFLSVPERLDYKRPISFQGFDMAAACGLIDRPVRRASTSPSGRFMWVELAGAGHGDHGEGAPERCLVDLETRTVTHDLVSRNPLYGLPTLIGWAGDHALLVSEAGAARAPEHWWWLDVLSHESAEVTLPRHGRLLPLPLESDGMLLLGLDLVRRGTWELSTYWLDGKREVQKLQTVRAEMPAALKEAEPINAALSPDKRYLLLSMRPIAAAGAAGTAASGASGAASTGSLVVVDLTGGTATALETVAPPIPEEPLFWAQDVRGGRYRFYYNGASAEGRTPCTGEMLVTPS